MEFVIHLPTCCSDAHCHSTQDQLLCFCKQSWGWIHSLLFHSYFYHWYTGNRQTLDLSIGKYQQQPKQARTQGPHADRQSKSSQIWLVSAAQGHETRIGTVVVLVTELWQRHIYISQQSNHRSYNCFCQLHTQEKVKSDLGVKSRYEAFNSMLATNCCNDNLEIKLDHCFWMTCERKCLCWHYSKKVTELKCKLRTDSCHHFIFEHFYTVDAASFNPVK